MSAEQLIIARASAELGEKYRVEIRTGDHQLTADEPVRMGGAGSGPAPYELLLSSLAACTMITLRMYAERKGMALEGVSIDLKFLRDRENKDQTRIDRTITVKGALSEAERARLADIAERTPVTLTLKSGVSIRTELRS